MVTFAAVGLSSAKQAVFYSREPVIIQLMTLMSAKPLEARITTVSPLRKARSASTNEIITLTHSGASRPMFIRKRKRDCTSTVSCPGDGPTYLGKARARFIYMLGDLLSTRTKSLSLSRILIGDDAHDDSTRPFGSHHYMPLLVIQPISVDFFFFQMHCCCVTTDVQQRSRFRTLSFVIAYIFLSRRVCRLHPSLSTTTKAAKIDSRIGFERTTPTVTHSDRCWTPYQVNMILFER